MMPEVEVGVGGKRTSEDVDDDLFNKKSRPDNIQLRLLLIGKFCGAIIGKGGDTINKLRKEYNVDVNLPATRTSDRVLTIEGSLDDCVLVVREILPLCSQAPYPINQRCSYEINILTHTESVGIVIGKGGAKIKEIREQSHGKIKVYQDCLPNSNERVVAIGSDTEEQMITALKIILNLLKGEPRRTSMLYDPVNKSNSVTGDGILPLMTNAWSNDGGGGGSFSQRSTNNCNEFEDDMQFSVCSEPTNFKWNKKGNTSNPDVYQYGKDDTKSSTKTKEETVLDQAISVLHSISENQRKPARDADEVFGQTVGLTLKNIPEKRDREYAKIKIQEILYQIEFGMNSGATAVAGVAGGPAPQYVERTQVQQTVYARSPPRNPQYTDDHHCSISNYSSQSSLPPGSSHYYNTR